MASSDGRAVEIHREYAIGGIVRVLCSVRLLVVVLAGADALMRNDAGLLALLALAASPFSFVPALNWNTRGPVYFRNGILLSGDIVVTVLVLLVLPGTSLMVAYGAATVALWGATTGLGVALLMAVPVATVLVPWRSVGDGWEAVVSSAIVVGAIAGMAWAGKVLGNGVRRHRQTAGELAQERAEHAAVEERLRIARDLHDTVAGDLAGMRLLSHGLRTRIEAGSDRAGCEELARALDDAVQVAHRHTRVALDELRSDKSLVADLERLVGRWESRTGMAPSVDVGGPIETLPRRVAGDVRAVVGELLENVRKHAAATTVSVAVVAAENGRSVVVTVEDDGRGMPGDCAPSGHYGLRGIRERAEACQGTAEWARSALGGTRARVTLNDPSAPIVAPHDRGARVALVERAAS